MCQSCTENHMWHLRISAMNALNYNHILTKFTTCVSLLMQVSIYVYIYLFIPSDSTVFGLCDVLIKPSFHVTLGLFFLKN